MADICLGCSLPHPNTVRENSETPEIDQLQDCVSAQKEAMVKLLGLVGKPDQCRGCQAPIFWLRHNNGKAVPYTPAGLNHFIDCPVAGQFARKA